MNFPDQHHFEQIRRRLWCNRDFGQAAVMVGAGFSRNAEKIGSGAPNMPTWTELAEQMYEELYPQDFLSKDKAKKVAIANPLGLASEYEAIFGRLALNEFLTRRIPNDQYNPGKLHKLLMSLPWSDVFTTNYDSLLERTRLVIHDRKYELVCKHEDVPGKMKPRIIKLHGSFPSHHPFIFTEEDYRTYPRKFAPFVNMVQQSIMENAFCLIGFSGDDPNFLGWIGWVRDNFGDLTPPIYLFGMDYSDAKKAVLKQKNILTIDVAPLFPKEKWSNSGHRHAKALEWFLLSLKNGTPPNLMNWPVFNNVKDNDVKDWIKYESLPSLLVGSLPDIEQEDFHSHVTVSEETLKQQCITWQKTRQAYPGWVICPRSNRQELWTYTKFWVNETFDLIDNIAMPDDIFLLYELNWRLEVTLTPLFTDWISVITTCLKRYNPYPELIEIDGANIRPDHEQTKSLDWKRISEAWIELAFALCRVAREDHDENSFFLWIGYLDKVINATSERRSRLFYEKCLFHIFRFEKQQAQEVLQAWPPPLSLNFWEVKRAAIHAELGDVKEAERIAELALDKIRSHQQPYLVDYSLCSQEGWAMYLLQLIKENNNFSDREGWFPHYLERWSQLRRFHCNPHDELEFLAERMDRIPEPPKRSKEVKKTFYPGRIIISHNFSSEEIWYSALPAFNILRMLEEAGIPIRCGSCVPYSAGQKAAKWIRPYAPLWSITNIVRSRSDSTCVNDFFTFTYIAVLGKDTVNYLYLKFYNFLSDYTQSVLNRKFISNISGLENLALIIELTSRLCFRLNDDQLKKLLNIATDLYKDIKLLERLNIASGVKNLFHGIFYTLSSNEIISILPDILSLPIGGEKEFNIHYTDNIPEPFYHIEIPRITKKNNELKNKISNQFQYLIRIIEESGLEARSRAILRVSKLFDAGYLNQSEKKIFAKALWSKLDSEYQFPENKCYHKYSFLLLPEPKLGIAKQKIVTFLCLNRDTDSINNINYLQEWIGSTNQPWTSNDTRISWPTEDINHLLNNVMNWWEQHKEQAIKKTTYLYYKPENSIESVVSKLIEVISYVILPYIGTIEQQVKDKIMNLLKILGENDFPVITALPMTLFIAPENLNDISIAMKETLNSKNDNEIQKADSSLFRWLAYSRVNQIPKPPSDLLDILINRVVTRHQPGLDDSLNWLSTILKEMPEQLNNEQIDSLCLALKYLINDVELPTLWEFEMELSNKSLIMIDDRPEYQKLCSQMTYHLYARFTKEQKEIPDIVKTWKFSSEQSALPEVRKIWE
jgi:hypothetical protein